ncbi:hypothetical protein SKUN_001072 [Spiroplasma kunkelii CR2-3x]|uniref:Uncharacterized protein n=1 Tax=Spiroplasma kunkelii CR2-3x TaxID=273035 RepID=A0A0K2JHP9_SPIKU|nr:hypothetical protein [Spiroplasma kunkelii]ALA97958.1 hypothetical protein SKUN_001072 [Spiroplasma kunkelii CR2-3x]
MKKQVNRIESEIINFMMKSPDGAKLYWQRAFNYKYSLQEKQLEQELNLNNQQPSPGETTSKYPKIAKIYEPEPYST